MKSSDDKLLSILSCAELNMSYKYSVYITYLLQSSGWGMNYAYAITGQGFVCRGMLEYLDEVISYGYVTEDDGVLNLTEAGKGVLNSFILNNADIEQLNYILGMYSTTTLEEIRFICLTSLMVTDIYNKEGVSGLMSKKDIVKNNLMRLCTCYSEDNFNESLKIINYLGGIK